MGFRIAGAIISAGMIAAGASAQVASPHANPHASSNDAVQSNHVRPTNAPAAGANSFTQAQARSRIAKAGYTRVSALRKDSNGLWQGAATQQGRKRHVALDYKGNVSSK